jgi:HYR domain
MKRALLLFAAVLGSLAVAAVRADADSVDMLQVDGTWTSTFSQVDCPAGTPATTNCYSIVNVGGAVVRGLGQVTTMPNLVFFDNFGTACARRHAEIQILVAGKGEIDLATKSSVCIAPEQYTRFLDEVTVTGGSGRYAGASGSGLMDVQIHETGPGSGNSLVTWTGPLTVAGVTFDTTPPQIAGATSKLVKTRLAAGARVRYAVSATDATDGILPAACKPKSGSLFRVGRTTVTCAAADSSGNTTTSRFAITVKRVR